MMLHRVFLSKLTFICLVFLSNLAFSNAQSLFIYRDFEHKGDENQIRGVVRTMSQSRPVEVQEFNVGQEEDLKRVLAKAPHEPKPILLAVGEKTVLSFSEMLPTDKATTAHLCHMATKDHPRLIDRVDFIVLPVHAVSEGLKDLLKGTRTNLIETAGVSHNRQIETVEKAYEERQEKFPMSLSYTGVILGGDAPTSQGEIVLFTEENSRHLAQFVKSFKGHFLITNGPRTGKYNPKTKEEIKTAHRDGDLDFVTRAFVDELRELGVHSDRFTVFDFQLGKSSNDMDLILGAIRATGGTMFVPGESTSSISESIDVLPEESVIVYENTAMNHVHMAHVHSELKAGRIKLLDKAGRIKLLDKDFQMLPPKASKGKETSPSAARTIASALLDFSRKTI